MRKEIFKMGQEVRNKINGFTGIITGITDEHTGVNSYFIVPTGLKDDGSSKPGEWCDEVYLELTDNDTIIELATDIYTPYKFNIGDTLKHKELGIKGIVYSRYRYATGCNRYQLGGSELYKNRNPTADIGILSFDEIDLKLHKSKKASKASKKTGGISCHSMT